MRASLGSTVSLIFQRGFALKSYTTDDGFFRHDGCHPFVFFRPKERSPVDDRPGAALQP